LLDTGNNFDFSLQHRHLREWAGIDPALLQTVGTVEINGKEINCQEARAWLYPNIPGQLKASPDKAPYLLEIRRGIVLHPPDTASPGPRLPLVGPPAFLHNDLDCWIDPERRHVTVQTRAWRRRLIRLFSRL